MELNKQKIPITAVVVCFNEAKYLKESLASLDFCDQIIVADLGSSDNSLEIARKYTDHVISIPRVQCVEMALESLINLAQHDWIISQDPDEVFSPKLVQQIRDAIGLDPKLAKIYTPLRFYFRGKLLNGTVWGGQRYKDRVFNRTRVKIFPLVHQGISVDSGFTTYKIPFEEDNYIKHYWVDSYGSMFEKHWRYIKNEGEARYTRGSRFSFSKWIKTTYRSMRDNLVTHHSLRDGWDGVFLTLFYTWYVGMSELSLLKYQLSIGRKNP